MGKINSRKKGCSRGKGIITRNQKGNGMDGNTNGSESNGSTLRGQRGTRMYSYTSCHKSSQR